MAHHITLLAATAVAFIRHKKKSLIALSFVMLFILSAIRYGYGNDFFPYLQIFNSIKAIGTHPHVTNEHLYILLNKLAPSFQLLIATISFIYLLVAYNLITKTLSGKYQGIAVLIFLLNPRIFLISLSAIRQSLAIALFVIAIHFSIRKKVVPFIITVVLASLCHTSAIFLLPIYFVANEKKVSKGFVIAFISTLLGLLFSSALVEFIFSAFEEFLSTRTNYWHYLEGETNTLRSTLLSSLYLIYLLINVRKLEGKILAYTKIYMFSIFIAILAYRVPLITRFQQYLDIFSIVSLPGIFAYNLENEKNSSSRLINVFVFPLLLLVVYILRYYSFFQTAWSTAFKTYQTILPSILG